MNSIIYVAVLMILVGAVSVKADQITWFDGSKDTNGAPGKLLTDNEGYWGDCVLTGVDYTYETQPDTPADIYKEDKTRFGRRLLDGYYSGNWWAPVGIVGRPLAVTLDFKRLCVFNEIDLITKSQKVNAKVEISTDNLVWKSIAQLSVDACADSMLQRIKVPGKPSGRYIKLMVDAGNVTYLDEVMAWGDADASDHTPEYLKPTVAQPIANGIALEGIPGIQSTACTDSQFFVWKTDLGKIGEKPAVWSALETWDTLTGKPILPGAKDIEKPIEIVMARNESECAAFALTNTSINAPTKLKVSLSAFKPVPGTGNAKGISGELRVGGAIPSRWYGVVIGPLFSQDNMLGKTFMQKFLTNGAGIMDFPEVTLSAAGSAIFWVTVKADMAKPGVYEAKLTYDGGNPQIIRVKVLDVKLPDPKLWLQSWSGTTNMFPFEYSDRMEREVNYKTSLGINVWNGWPDKGTPAEAARKKCKAIYHIWGIGDYGNKIYGGGFKADQITPEVEKEVIGIIQGHVKKARELGLKYDEWYVELTDEPGMHNAEAYGAFCRIIRKADPKVNIYCNPSFWVGFENGAISPDKDVYKILSPWYNDCIDVSCPLFLHLDNRPESAKLFGHKRFVDAFYSVSSHHAKSERRDIIEEYRRFAWKAISLGWNGWGYYSYFAPRGNPWNDFDEGFITAENLPDYQVVYPGPRGPIPTRHAEAFREGWEDYRLLSLLSKQKPEVFKKVIKAYKDGKDIEKLRLMALEALAAK